MLKQMTIAIITTAMMGTALGQTPQPGGGLGIAALEKFLTTQYDNATSWVKHRAQKPISALHLSAIEDANMAKTKSNLTPTQATITAAQLSTTRNLSNSLRYFVYNLYKEDTGPLSKAPKSLAFGKPNSFAIYANQNTPTALASSNASDSLYLPSTEVTNSTKLASTDQKNQLIQSKNPTPINNGILNFAAVIAPTTYTPTQYKNAKAFIKYAARSTQDPSSALHLSLLRQKPQALYKLTYGTDSAAYRKFQFNIRTLLAIRSVLVNNLNTIIMERHAMPGLAKAVVNNAGAHPKTASPLQVEKYQANHRITNPAWYKKDVQNAAPSTVQRETLIVLAEIEHQNYQAHLDRERILSTLTAMALTNSAAMGQQLVKQQGAAVNKIITRLTRP